MPSPGRSPQPSLGSLQQQVKRLEARQAALLQRVATLEKTLAALLKELEERKRFFV